MMTKSDDYRFMSQTLRLAESGLCTTHPNPRVGCVVVRDGEIVAEAWHKRAGEPHAEVLALRQAGERARGATVYVNLEPCCHQGRTPPCIVSLIDAGVARVVTAMEDPNPEVSNGGISSLRNAGIDVDVGVMREQAERLNRGFVHRMRHRRPWVMLKLAASIDGRTAMASGESKWITSEASRADVHRLRAKSSAIMTGIGTILADDPALTVRLEGFDRQPMRVIVDSHLTMDANARVMTQPEEVLIYTAIEDRAQVDRLTHIGADVVRLPGPKDRVDLSAMMEDLAARGVNELLVEAGRTLSGTLVRSGLINELILYLAPHILGDAARGMFRLPEIERLSDRVEFKIGDVRRIGPDLRLILCP